MIRVCMFVPDFDRTGGYEKQAFSLSRHLKRKGLGVFILTNKRGKDAASFEDREGIVIRRILPPPGKSLQYGFALFRAFLSFFIRFGEEFDLIHAHALTPASVLGMLIGKAFGKKSLIKIATEGDLEKFVHSPLFTHRVPMKLLKHADCCISISNSIKEELLFGGVPSRKIFSTFNGVDTEVFKPLDAEGSSRKKGSLSLPHKMIVTFVGRFVHRKGIDVLLRAWGRVVSGRPDAHLILIGFGDEEAGLRDLARNIKIEESVTFLGEITNVIDYLQASDLFVIPSRKEGNPNTLLEASACGLPVVATSIGGIVEVVKDGQSGVLVPSDDEEALAGKILLLLGDEEYRMKLAENARSEALSRFSFETIGSRYEELYRTLVEG